VNQLVRLQHKLLRKPFTWSTVVVAGSFDHPSAARGTGMTKLGTYSFPVALPGRFFPCRFPWNSSGTKNAHRSISCSRRSLGACFICRCWVTITEYINLLFNNQPCRFINLMKQYGVKTRNHLPDFDLFQKEFSPKEYLSKMLNNHGIPEISRSIMEVWQKWCGIELIIVEKRACQLIMFLWLEVFRKVRYGHNYSWCYGSPVTLIQGEYAGCLGASILSGIGLVFKNESDGLHKWNINFITLMPDRIMTK